MTDAEQCTSALPTVPPVVNHVCDCQHVDYHPQGHAAPSWGCQGCRTCQTNGVTACHCGADAPADPPGRNRTCRALTERLDGQTRRLFTWDPDYDCGVPNCGGYVATWTARRGTP